jgi:hypothetical protein
MPPKVTQGQIVSEQRPSPLRERDLTAVTGTHHPRPAMHVESE